MPAAASGASRLRFSGRLPARPGAVHPVRTPALRQLPAGAHRLLRAMGRPAGGRAEGPPRVRQARLTGGVDPGERSHAARAQKSVHRPRRVHRRHPDVELTAKRPTPASPRASRSGRGTARRWPRGPHSPAQLRRRRPGPVSQRKSYFSSDFNQRNDDARPADLQPRVVPYCINRAHLRGRRRAGGWRSAVLPRDDTATTIASIPRPSARTAAPAASAHRSRHGTTATPLRRRRTRVVRVPGH